ncbi:MAG TPA: flagellar motor protein MotB [Steroidobacteraceae bacterium]|nr:flagellar motor protein MotB [Steroidobacteraceae bacterium]
MPRAVRRIHPRRNCPETSDEQSNDEKRTVKRPIVIKRIHAAKTSGHAGSWKVAFADFATAMMAFFLTMWLMGATTEDQRGGISQYFNNPTMVQGKSPSPSPSVVRGQGGAAETPVRFGSDVEIYPEHSEKDNTKADSVATSKKEDAIVMAIDVDAEREKQRLQWLKMNLKLAIEQQPTLKKYSDHILMDLTAEGLRIQMIDSENRSMFPLGSSELEPFGAEILRELASLIATVPNRISISGHTDNRPYQRVNYSNWELSIDRANAARRSLLAGGLPEDKIGRVVGLSEFAPLDRNDLHNPINRRISIVVLNRRTEKAIVQESGALFGVQTNLE